MAGQQNSRNRESWRCPALFATLTLLCLCAGCATVRRARDAQDGARAPGGERTVTAAEIGLGTNSVLTLDEALRIAIACHPSIAQASQNLASATALAREAGAAYQPSLDASAGYRRGTSNSEGAPESSDTREAYSGALDLDLLLYDFGRTPAVVRQARANQLAARESLAAARSDVAFNVRLAFYAFATAQELLLVAGDSVRQFEAHLAQVRAYAEVGRRIRYDVTKAEVDLGNARLSLIEAQNAVATSRATLNRSLGLAGDPGYRLGEAGALSFSGNVDTLMSRARGIHPELLALRAQEMAASAAVDQAIADLYPSLRLRGEYGMSGSDFPLTWNWWGALQSSLGVFSGGRRIARIDESAARLRSARTQCADREQRLYLEISSAWNQWVSANRRTELSDLIVREARESLDLINERYRTGQASAVEITDAQTALTRARADQVKARLDCQTSIARIRHAMGEE